MKSFNLSCVSCKNQLLECGLLLDSDIGPLICCNVCRTLYYADVIINTDNKPVIVIQPIKNIDQNEEYEIIRTARSNVPLSEYIPKLEKENGEEKIIDPYFKQDLKSTIADSVTPSDLVRKLHQENI